MGQVITKDEWMKKGRELFGEDIMKWRFVCPGCGNGQAIGDFRQFKDKGATPNSATCECIGRYTGGRSWAKVSKGQPCDYASYGLFNIAPIKVMDGEKVIYSFAFKEEINDGIKRKNQ